MTTHDKGQEPQHKEVGPARGGSTARSVSPVTPGLRSLQLLVSLVVVLIGAGGALYLMFSGPRMRVEPKLLPYQARLPAMPKVTVPVFPVAGQPLASVRNPLADAEQTLRAGKAHYTNYCTFCHGKEGHGDGPVGRSYMPVPTDLTSPAVQGLPDEALYRRMLIGVGHAPVLSDVVDPEARWYIVSYVRSLRGKE
jgi:mono/diheme cytochrome c family protein